MRFEWGIVALAFSLRLAAVLWLSDTVPYSDFVLYHAAALEIVRDPRFLVDPAGIARLPPFNLWPPGYPIFLAAVYAFLGTDYRMAVFAQVLLGTLVCWLTARLATEQIDRRTGRIAALLMAVNPTFIFLTNQLASENLFVLWLVLVLWVTLRGVQRPRRALLLGALVALGAMTRAIGLILPFVLLPWLRFRFSSWRPWWGIVAWFMLGLGTVLAPWTLRNLAVTGHPAVVCFGGGLNFYFGHNEAGPGYRDLAQTPFATLRDPAAIDAAAFRSGWSFMAAHPLDFFTSGVGKVKALFGFPDYALHVNSGILVPDARGRPQLQAMAQKKLERQRQRDRLLHGPLTWWARLHSMALLVLGAVGMFVAIRQRRAGLLLCLLLVVGWTMAHVVFWAQPRFRAPLEVPLSILAAAAVVQIVSHLRRQSR